MESDKCSTFHSDAFTRGTTRPRIRSSHRPVVVCPALVVSCYMLLKRCRYFVNVRAAFNPKPYAEYVFAKSQDECGCRGAECS